MDTVYLYGNIVVYINLNIYFRWLSFATWDGSKTITRPDPVPIVSILAAIAFVYALPALSRDFLTLSRSFLSFSLSGLVSVRLCASMKRASVLSTEAFVALSFLLAELILASWLANALLWLFTAVIYLLTRNIDGELWYILLRFTPCKMLSETWPFLYKGRIPVVSYTLFERALVR